MKRFLTVFGFELSSYTKNKSFVISTIVIAILLFAATFLPRVFDMSEILGTAKVEQSTEKDDGKDKKDSKAEDKDTYGFVNRTDTSELNKMMEQVFPEDKIKVYDDEAQMKKDVKKEKIVAGFVVESFNKYTYYVLNQGMFDEHQALLDEVLAECRHQQYCMANNIDYESLTKEYKTPVESDIQILGKDAAKNYWYCYALTMIIFMIIILYCVMIATSVTQEKSNRAIEVLVTSIDSKYLLFGKVFAGALAAFVQIGAIMAALLIGYGINHEAWGDKLDVVLDIPPEVLTSFALFGIGGFLFYAFLYGALGALVSKTEDIQKSVGSLQMVIMVVYFVVLFQLQSPDGIIMKVCSFLPFSSYAAMFVRIGMGSVDIWEILVSAVLLVVSTAFVGWLGAKIYRMGTLRYGNPIKLTTALKDLKQAE